jgi:hypothetical protein
MDFDYLGHPILTNKTSEVDSDTTDTLSVALRPSRTATETRRLLRRAKRSERDFAKWLVKHNGPDGDPTHMSIMTSTGRVGHVTNIQADCLSRSYMGENKNEILPAKFAKYWQKICQVASQWSKEPVLRMDAADPKKYMVNGKPLPVVHLISEERHGELLLKEQELDLCYALLKDHAR